jgi:RNA-directed DNA polymerase
VAEFKTQDGLVSPRVQGTPQGGPLSPLLSNIVLTELDRELERRGHAFCRYADECNVYVRSRQAGERALASLTRFIPQRLKLEVNVAKSAVDEPWGRKFLGYSITWHREPKLRVAIPSLHRLENRVRELLRGARGRSVGHTIEQLNPLLRGWAAYFKLTDTKQALEMLDGWIRRKLRCVLWRQCKRAHTRARHLMKRGLTLRACMAFGDERAGSVVERGRLAYECGLAQIVVRFHGAGLAARYRAAPPACFMNRRMRNRTYGGVGGRRG